LQEIFFEKIQSLPIGGLGRFILQKPLFSAIIGLFFTGRMTKRAAHHVKTGDFKNGK
jgi:hypothetical protein